MSPILCLIVDDEPLAQQVLEKYVADCPGLAKAGVCNDAFEAADFLRENSVQLLFLDVNMPRLSGISLLKSLPNPPLVIFTTAYPDHAVAGFELDAVDYLVKPFSFERFYKAVQKAQERIQWKTAPKEPSAVADFISVKVDKKLYRLDFQDIYYLEAYGDYVKAYLADRYLLVSENLKSLSGRLPENRFVRIHKSFLVALDKVDFDGGNQVSVRQTYLPVSQTAREELVLKLGGK